MYGRVAVRLFHALALLLSLSAVATAHTGLLDGYGCHRGKDKVSYHCHEGEFAGRTFKSKDEFLKELRSGKSERLSPKNYPPKVERKRDDF
ncbi:MAG TPA: hypothetical protein VIB79_13335 [Candidatus Binatia bacterium]|jgi:hypothetical protein